MIFLRMFLFFAGVLAGFGQVPSQIAPFPSEESRAQAEEAKKLLNEGDEKAAFLSYFENEFYWGRAIKIGKEEPQKYLTLLENEESIQAIVITSELQLSLGLTKEARMNVRRVAELMREEEGFKKSYLVDLELIGSKRNLFSLREPIPFSSGPGSHRDNWLIRRALAFKMKDIAQQEFARMWGIYRDRVMTSGVDHRARKFALDYAVFLQREKETEKGFQVLLEVFRNINMTGGFWETGLRGDLVMSSQPRPFTNRDFIRLAYGYFKGEGRESDLLEMLEKEIEGGNNLTRKVLARVHFLRNEDKAALALESDYLDAGEFDDVTKAMTLGIIYDEVGRTEEALAYFEKSVGLGNVSQEVWDRMTRLYRGLGRLKEAFTASLKALEAEPLSISEATLKNLARQAKALKQEQALEKWLRSQLENEAATRAFPVIYLQLGEVEKAAQSFAENWTPRNGDSSDHFDSWLVKFEVLGKEQETIFFNEFLKRYPDDLIARTRKMERNDDVPDSERIKLYEDLLAETPKFVIARYEKDFKELKFRNFLHLTGDLLQLYDKAEEAGKFRKLAFQLAEGDEPFGEWWITDKAGYRDSRQVDGNRDLWAALSIVIEQSDLEVLEKLHELWKSTGDHPAMRQLKRRLRGSFIGEEKREEIPWANVPDGVRLIVSDKTVTSIAHDEDSLYVGYPWGIEVNDHAGTPVIRIALEAVVDVIAPNNDVLWLGTSRGLCRINIGTWEVTFLTITESSGGKDQGHSYRALLHDGDELWIAANDGIQRLNKVTMTCRYYSPREMGMSNKSEFSQLLLIENRLWVSGDDGLFRYEREGDSFTPVTYNEISVTLIGMINGVLYGNVYVNEQLRNRPCMIDPVTLKVKLMLIETASGETPEMLYSPFSFCGESKGGPVFTANEVAYRWEKDVMKLKQIGMIPDLDEHAIQSILSNKWFLKEVKWSRPLKMPEVAGDQEIKESLVTRGEYCLASFWPGSPVVFGRKDSYASRYDYRGSEWPYRSAVWDRKLHSTGLFVKGETGEFEIKNRQSTNTIPGESIFDIVASSDGGVWLCTNLGLALIDEEGSVQGSFTKEDGLMVNRVLAGIAEGDQVFFASRWGREKGGIIVADIKTSVFSSIRQKDGMRSDALFAQVKGAEENVSFTRDPFLTGNGLKSVKRVPLLGGLLLKEVVIAGRRYLGTTRGLMILEEGAALPDMVETERVMKVNHDPEIALEQAAENFKMKIRTVADFAAYVENENPYIRHKALEYAWSYIHKNPELYLPTLRNMTEGGLAKTRKTVIEWLGKFEDRESLARIQSALTDPDQAVRDEAALSLVQLGAAPEIGIFEKMFERGAYSGENIRRFEILAKVARPEFFELLLRDPIGTDDYEPRQKVFINLGESLRKNPALADILLKARNAGTDVGPKMNYGRIRFAREVFRHAGPSLLPQLHQALESNDRVIRSNAAQACGSILDPSSIKPLLKALDFESGLSQASIVWALGELKAREASLRLVSLYESAMDDSMQEVSIGYRAENFSAAVDSQFDEIGSLDQLWKQFDELNRPAFVEVISPEVNEWLLTPEIILQALKKIGYKETGVPDFYRSLAGGRKLSERQEAARGLVSLNEDEIEKNLSVLRSLKADPSIEVRVAATVSLLILDQIENQKEISLWLGKPELGECRLVIEELLRVKNPKTLEFTKDLLQLRLKDRKPQDRRIIELLRRMP